MQKRLPLPLPLIRSGKIGIIKIAVKEVSGTKFSSLCDKDAYNCGVRFLRRRSIGLGAGTSSIAKQAQNPIAEPDLRSVQSFQSSDRPQSRRQLCPADQASSSVSVVERLEPDTRTIIPIIHARAWRNCSRACWKISSLLQPYTALDSLRNIWQVVAQLKRKIGSVGTSAMAFS